MKMTVMNVVHLCLCICMFLSNTEGQSRGIQKGKSGLKISMPLLLCMLKPDSGVEMLSPAVLNKVKLFKASQLKSQLSNNVRSGTRASRGGDALPIPIDQIIEEAEDSRMAASAEPTFMPAENAVKFEGDMLMSLGDFTASQSEISVDLLTDAMIEASERGTQLTAEHVRDMMRSGEEFSAAVRSERRLWPDAVMPIRIASTSYRLSEIRRIEQAMNDISEATCVCFRTISRSEARRVAHVRMLNRGGCNSYVGRRRGRIAQNINLRPRCRSRRIITHEILHALGMFHEQSRPDRDNYVRINTENIRTGRRHNFYKHSNRTIDSRGLAYDYLSLMHYSNRAFSRGPGRFTIVPVPEANRVRFMNSMGRARAMSNLDAEVLNLMYNCPRRPVRPACMDYPYRFLRSVQPRK